MNCKEAQARAIFPCQDSEGVVSSESCGVADSVGAESNQCMAILV
jgi:hypothetical protein